MNNDDLIKFYSAFAIMAFIIRQDPEDTMQDIVDKAASIAEMMVEAVEH